MATPELVLCINQSWGCRLNQVYECLDHHKCVCNDPNDKGLIEIKGESSIAHKNPKGMICTLCGASQPKAVWHFFPARWFVPITGPDQQLNHTENEELFKPSVPAVKPELETTK